jgi:hypothetical protein
LLTATIFLLYCLVNAERVSAINIQQDIAFDAVINTPVTGQVVQGVVVIRGNTSMDGFQSYEVDFAYSADRTQTWFLIQESTLPIQDGVLAVWDTSNITDGDYDLRVTINQSDGAPVEIQVSDLRVRNYTPMETESPTPTLLYATSAPGIPTVTPILQASATPMTTSLPPTPTSLPANPAEISTSQLILTFGKGAAVTLGIFAILGAYVVIRASLSKHK